MKGGYNFIDMTGRIINDWTVIRYVKSKGWECRCKCGKVGIIDGHALRIGKYNCCRSCSDKKRIGKLRHNYSGEKIKQWDILKYMGNRKYLAKCSCGIEQIVAIRTVLYGDMYCCDRCDNTRLGKDISAINKLFSNYRTNAKRFNRNWNIDIKEFSKMIYKDCFYCGKKPNEEPKNNHIVNKYKDVFNYNGIDRIDNNKGYEDGNIVTCCYICNRAKLSMSQELFIVWINRIKNSHSVDKKFEYC